MTTERYAAQICLPEVGEVGQETLSKARIIVVGAGGLGTVVLPVLVGAGIGHIHIIDDDVVEEGNLHRQTLYTMDDIGRNKAECAAEHLIRLNPSVRIIPHPAGAQSDMMAALLRELSANDLKKGMGNEKHAPIIVIDAADNFAATYMLSDLCRDFHLPLISASAIRWGGYVGIFCGPAPSYRAVFPDLTHMALNCQTAGVLGSVVGLVGMIQAQLCFSLLLNITPSPVGNLYRWDAKELRLSHFSFIKADEPEKAWPFLAYSQLKNDDFLIDVRNLEEKPALSHPHLRHIPLDLILQSEDWGKEPDLPKTGRIVLCCQSGVRASRAACHLYESGYRHLALLAIKHQALT